MTIRPVHIHEDEAVIDADLARYESNLGIPCQGTVRWAEKMVHADGRFYFVAIGEDGWNQYTKEQALEGVVAPVELVDFPWPGGEI